MPQIIRARSTGNSATYLGIPVYSLVAAGGPFRDNLETRRIGSIHPPENLKSPDQKLFVALVEGHSMEPIIVSGSYCLFRYSVAGSRSSRTVLVEERQIAACAYTLKRYERRPPPRDNPNARGRVFLVSMNPDQPDIELDEDGETQDQRYDVIAEFIRVLEPPLKWITTLFGESAE